MDFPSKEAIQVKKKKKKRKERGKSHISKIVKQQGTHHLKSNPKFWSFVGKTPGSKVEKLLGRHNSRFR